MEQHGKKPRKDVIAIIPARYKSVRLEGKLLLPIAERPLILHTLEKVAASSLVNRIIVAVDDKRILEIVEEAGYEAVLTSPEHQSGTDRVAEVAGQLDSESIIVNVQADEPLIDPGTIDNAVAALENDPLADIATCSELVSSFKEVLDPNVVKVVTDSNGFALYFSRSPIPYPRDAVLKEGSLAAAFDRDPGILGSFRKHTGIYVFRKPFLMRFAAASQTGLEKLEKLEQLRALEMGAKIKVAAAASGSVGVDTLEDYERVRFAVEGSKV